MTKQHRIIALSVVLALLAWVIDAVLCYSLFHEGTFWGLMITTVPPHEVYVRLAAMVLLVSFGVISATVVGRLTRKREALRRSEESLSASLRSIGDGVITTDAQGRVTFVNPVAESLTGWEADAALNKPLADIFNIINEETGEPAKNPVGRVLREGAVVGLANHTTLISKDGTRRPIDDSGAPINDETGKIIGTILVFHDITERRESEKRIKHLNSVLHAVRGVNQLITREMDRERLIQGVCGCLVETRGYGRSWIMVCDESSDYRNAIVVGAGDGADRLAEQLAAGTPPACLGECLQQTALLAIEDPREKHTVCPVADATETEGALCIRLEHAGRILGTMGVTLPRHLANDPEEQALFTEVADDIAFALRGLEQQEQRQRAEETLRESEERFRDVAFSMADWIWEVDARGVYTYCSEKVQEVLGYSVDEIIGKTPFDFMSPEEEEKIGGVFRGILEEKKPIVDLENWNITKDGTPVCLLTNGVPLLDTDGNVTGYRGVDRDITERKRAQEEIRSTREFLGTVIEKANGIVLTLDEDANITTFNSFAEQLTDYTRAEVIGKNWFETFIPERDRKGIPTIFQKTLQEMPEVSAYENPILTKSGEERIINWSNTVLKSGSGQATGVLSIGVDVTERRRAEDALAQERERLNVTLQSIGDGVIATDTDGRVTLINEVAEKLTGWHAEDAMDQPLEKVFRIINEKSRAGVQNPVERVIKSGLVIGLANHTVLVARDGKERSIADSGAPIQDPHGRIIGVVLVFRDITETRRLQELASRAQRLETAGRIAGQVAHDFNNLLAPLMAYPPFIKEAIPAGHEAAEFVEKIEKAADQMAEINQQLLTLGRRGHYTVEPFSLNETVRQVVRQVQPVSETLVIDVDFCDDLMLVKGGPSQIYRVVSNLVSNALDAMQDTGRLGIRTENFYVDSVTGKHGRIPTGEYVKLTVADTGSGIP
ncbi:MAG: PAS domain S-box protein, partial [candidate division Zixibacteria bacterium]|nr:PAS domain S-box protein [candidate division Zixibacteria bacterium]